MCMRAHCEAGGGGRTINMSISTEGERERERENVLFNDALNTFYLRLYGVRHMVKDHSDSEKGNPLLLSIFYLVLSITRVLLYAPSHRQNNTYHGLCYTSRGALAGTRNSSMGPHHEGSIRRPIAPWANALPLSYVPLPHWRHAPHEIKDRLSGLGSRDMLIANTDVCPNNVSYLK